MNSSTVRETARRVDDILRVLDEAGIDVASVSVRRRSLDVQVGDGMVAAAAFALGWSACHETFGDEDEMEQVQVAEGPSYWTDYVYGRVSAQVEAVA